MSYQNSTAKYIISDLISYFQFFDLHDWDLPIGIMRTNRNIKPATQLSSATVVLVKPSDTGYVASHISSYSSGTADTKHILPIIIVTYRITEINHMTCQVYHMYPVIRYIINTHTHIYGYIYIVD